MKVNTRWIANSDQFVFNHKPKGCCLMVASVDLGLGTLDVCHQVETEKIQLLVLGKTERSIVGYQIHYPGKPEYLYTDDKLFFAFFSPPSKRRKSKILYQDTLLMVNVFGSSHAISVVLKNKFWI